MNILVADDDAVTRLLLTSALSKLGHKLREAEDGRDALALWERERQHLIISDWMMPDRDGLDFCRQVRGDGLIGEELSTARLGLRLRSSDCYSVA